MDKIEVLFYDEDEKTLLDRQHVNSGDKVIYKGKEPFKAPENQINYYFIGWSNEEKLECVTENLILVAKYETSSKENIEKAFYKATFESSQNVNLNATVEAFQKVNEQQKVLEKDSRSAQDIVKEIITNGKIELGVEPNKEDIER